ncbi:MAG: hypothetical protein ABW146_13830 [Candidatus Sedimenticola sp. 6PFRAG7]
MPIEVGIWRIDDRLRKVSFSSMETELKLEDTLSEDIAILSPDLMLIGRQIPTAHGKFIDLLAMDGDGNLSVIELKKNRTPREVVAQLLDYASWVQTLSYDDITEIYSERNEGKEFEEGFAEVFDTNPPDKLNEQLQLVIVAAELDHASERIITYLADNFGVPINAVFFRYFKDGDSEYLIRTWLIDPQEAEVKTSKSSGAKGKETWNGQDFYVSFGEGPHDRRDWDDARKYGFISAGGGRWYSRTLEQLFTGSRVFVCIPGTGYVGVGKVLGPTFTINEFTVEHDGKTSPILDVPLKAKGTSKGADSPDTSEYFVPIEWIKTIPRDQAHWEKGMFANQNTVTKLRNRFTLERLMKYFELTE